MWKGVVVTVLLGILWSGFLPEGHTQEGGSAAARIEAARARVQAAGVPAELINDKVAEGQAKGIPPGRVAAAVEARAAALVRAAGVMRRGAGVSAQDLRVGADALQAGVSEAILGRISEVASSDVRAIAIAVLTQLVRQGEPPGSALQRVENALAEGPDALQNLPNRPNDRP